MAILQCTGWEEGDSAPVRRPRFRSLARTKAVVSEAVRRWAQKRREVAAISRLRARGCVALGLGAIGLAGLGVVLVMAQGSPRAADAAEWAAAATDDVVVAVTPMGDGSVLVCLVDRTKDRLAVYVADARRSRLKLLAVRDISADWALTDYNNDPPLPKDIRARVEAVTEKPAAPAAAEESGVSPPSP